MTGIKLSDRGLVRIKGPDAPTLLQNTLTCNVENLGAHEACAGALLSPQGKVLFTFILICVGRNAYLIDLNSDDVSGFVQRMQLYKLRSKLEITTVSPAWTVHHLWGDDGETLERDAAAITVPDPRLHDLGWRIYQEGAPSCPGDGPLAAYHTHRIALGVPEQGYDFRQGEQFAHDVALDTLNGIDNTKGCYVGQEVVSRVHHRGRARRRPVRVTGAFSAASAGEPICAGDRCLGILTSAISGQGIALLRLDHVQRAVANNETLHIKAEPVVITLPSWANYDWPQASPSCGAKASAS